MEKDYSPALPVGTILRSPEHTYVIKDVLGQGGFGITYRVTTVIKAGNINMTVPMAIKEHFLKEHSMRDTATRSVTCSQSGTFTVRNSLKDFISEARRLQSLSGIHPGIVCVNEIIETNNTAYYVMEYLDGPSLQESIKSGIRRTEDDVLDIMYTIIDAVATLHANHITHLDIKPANIILTTDGQGLMRPVLIDFGLSKHYDNTGEATSTVNTFAKSPGYSPVEQDKALTTFSPRADIYSLGATMYALLTGHRPDDAFDIDLNRVDAELRSLGISQRVRSAITGAMAFRSTDRTPSAAALASALYGTDAPATHPTVAPHDHTRFMPGYQHTSDAPQDNDTHVAAPAATRHGDTDTPRPNLIVEDEAGINTGNSAWQNLLLGIGIVSGIVAMFVWYCY